MDPQTYKKGKNNTRQLTVESSCEFGNEPSGSIKCWETIEWPNNWWPLE
jgi:hypothetical protein